jgi:hypothetical protein
MIGAARRKRIYMGAPVYGSSSRRGEGSAQHRFYHVYGGEGRIVSQLEPSERLLVTS